MIKTIPINCYGGAAAKEGPLPWPQVYTTADHPIWERTAGDTAVVFCHFNPAGFARPRWNLNAFLTGLLRYNVPVFGAELSFDGHFELPPHPHVKRLEGSQETHRLFQKEPLWNVAESIVPQHFDKLIFLDADILFSSKTWLEDARQALTRHRAALPFSTAVWTKPGGEFHFSKPSSTYAAACISENLGYRIEDSHPGFGIAIRRRAFHEIGGLHGCPLTGGGDAMFTHAAMGNFSRSAKAGLVSDAWCKRVSQVIAGKIGYVSSEARHLWHGDFKNRRYDERHRWLGKFRRAEDTCLDASGAVRWSEHAIATKADFITQVNDYYSGRKEDG